MIDPYWCYENPKEAAAEIERLLKLTDWQPIETAPKDGTVVDLFRCGHRVPNCSWRVNHNVLLDGWVYSPPNGGKYAFHKRDPNPTHWMPLPEPPSEIDGPKEGEE